MEVVIGKTAGFCAGVNYAVKTATKNIENKEIDKLYCLGELVHNGQVVKKLENQGMITVDNIEDVPDGETVIFRAHGEAESVYLRAEEKNLKVIDLTCGKVRIIHDKVKKQRDNAFIIIIGKRKHPEIIATKGFAGPNSYVIESDDDILDAYMEYEKTLLGKVYIVAQTTFSSAKFDYLKGEIEKDFCEAELLFDKTICDATEKRQAETLNLSEEFKVMVVIGGKNSSNTKELVNLAKDKCETVYSIETVSELENEDFTNVDKVCIMAGASTPQESILEVKEFLENK